MCLCQVSLLSRCSLRYLASSCLGEMHIVYKDRGHVSFRVVIDLDPLVFIHHFLNQFWIANGLVYSLCEAMAGSLYVATTALSSAKVAMVDCGEVGRSAVYRRYNNGPRTLPWGMPALTGEHCVYSVSTFTS
jgi:hypothetical protein